MNVDIESITQVQTSTGLTVRVWRAEQSRSDAMGSRSDLVAAVRANEASADLILEALLSMPRGDDIAAVEIKDAYGNGLVEYYNWP